MNCYYDNYFASSIVEGEKQQVVVVTFTLFIVCMYVDNGWQVECCGCAISVK